jgi:pyruvate-ferredoxin/flavodoxin oxidoreductase
MTAKYPGLPTVIHGNGAVAEVMSRVCGGVIGYPITPSTEISEIYEAFRSNGGVNVWGKHPFFFEPEGEHSAQSGALGAALTGGKFVSNASSSQGILYGMESHYVTVGKRVGGFVLQVAARVVSKHSLNVMAGHDDVYALLASGYTILFGSNAQEAADLAAISYKLSALSLIPVANAMDGFATSHMMTEAKMPEPDLLREYLGDPAGRIKSPTVAQDMLFGAKGRTFQLRQYLTRRAHDFADGAIAKLRAFLDANEQAIEHDGAGRLVEKTLDYVPEELRAQWRRQWVNAFEKGTRQLVPALVDVHNPGLTGGVQNQPDFQSGSVDHRTHFVSEVPHIARETMAEYSKLTGRPYAPILTYMCDDAETVLLGLGSVTDDAQAVAAYLRTQGKKVGVISIKLLQPFPEAEVVAALKGKKSVTVLERSEVTALTSLVTQALFKARENAEGARHPEIPALREAPKVITAIFGLGAHDLQPRHIVAAYKNMEEKNAPFVYLGSQFFSKNPSPHAAALQARLKAAYPETEFMALETGPNPNLLPKGGFRTRFHSVGGYGTIATGKLLTDILAGVLGLHSKAAPKYGSEKSGAPTNYYITLSPEPVLLTNADLEDVEIVVSPDHRVFSHSNPLRGLVEGGTFILQSNLPAIEVWKELPPQARKAIRDRKINFFVLDGFAVAKRHAPRPELETRMMGIAFIGAICGNCEQVTAGASPETVLKKIRHDLSKKFGAKGAAIVEGNMAVIQDAVAATKRVAYDEPEFALAETVVASRGAGRSVGLSAAFCRTNSTEAPSGFLDAEYFDDIYASAFRDGTIAESPVLPGTGMFLPAGSAAGKDKGLFRLKAPEFLPDLCTGCMECALACPDAAIPNTVHDIRDLLSAGIRQLDIAESQRESVRAHIPALVDAAREVYRREKSPKPFYEIVGGAIDDLEVESAVTRSNLRKLANALVVFPVAKTRPFFDAAEKDKPGSGGLFSAVIDPWKCTGCLECVEVCGPHALVEREQDAELLDMMQARFEFLSRTPNTPARFYDAAIGPDGDAKRLMLDRHNYYATTGGHGACRGCGEVTAIRLVTSTNHAIHDKRRREQIRQLESLIDKLNAKAATVADTAEDSHRKQRVTETIASLEKGLYLLESGPRGDGPASAVIANATGCSSVYASTFPFNPYTDPWVNSLFQDSPAVAKGVFEGLGAEAVEQVRALRVAQLELADAYDPQVHDKLLRTLSWAEFTPEELNLLPTVLSIGGDGATYDIGFGALSRVLSTSTPIKVVVLNTGAYSNTGGQASTASLTGQDSDLARFGSAHSGKQERRKELSLIAAFHPNVYVVQSCASLHGHFLKYVVEFLNHNDSPAVLDVYTPCQGEQGISDPQANRHGHLAVQSRMSPVFVHDPRRGSDLRSRFSLDGNPAADKDWTTTVLEYVEGGQTKLIEVPLTPADFALTEGRFKKQFRPFKADAAGVPLAEYIDLGQADRIGKTPFVLSVDDDKKLVKIEASPTIVALVEERRRYWRTLQYLAGQDVARLDADHQLELDALRHQYEEAVEAREGSIDSIAQAMSELAAASKAPPAGGLSLGLGGGAAVAPAAAPAAAAKPNGAAVALSEDDVASCTNCKTCYQELPELFEKTRVVVDGATKEAGHLIPGALARVKITPEIKSKIARVAANCDAEIIHEH